MVVYLNGQFVEETQAKVSVFDRGFTLGESVFEALRVQNGKIFRLEGHLERLKSSAEFVGIPMPPEELLAGAVQETVNRNQIREGMVRVTISGGETAHQRSPNVAITLREIPKDREEKAKTGFRVITSNFRVPVADRIVQHKTGSRLLNILAFGEAEKLGADEAILLNTEGHLTEGTSSNLFWFEDQTVCTSPVNSGVLPGITRNAVLELARRHNLVTKEKNIIPEELYQSHGAFLTFSSLGLVEILYFDNHGLARSGLFEKLKKAYEELLDCETR